MTVQLLPGDRVTNCDDCPCAFPDALVCNLGYKMECGTYYEPGEIGHRYARHVLFSRECGLVEIRMADAEPITPTALVVPTDTEQPE